MQGRSLTKSLKEGRSKRGLTVFFCASVLEPALSEVEGCFKKTKGLNQRHVSFTLSLFQTLSQ